MSNHRSIISLFIILCISIMPAAGHARCEEAPLKASSDAGGKVAGNMADCPFMKAMLARSGPHSEEEQGRSNGCAPATCFLKCFHSTDVVIMGVQPKGLPLSFDVEDFLPPIAPPHEPPTPPPQA
jgi:hypothetical protein